jgi:hypothetical protein
LGYDIETNEMSGICSTYGGEERYVSAFWWGNLRERDHLEDPSIDGRLMLRWIFRKWKGGAWTGSCWLTIGTGECGNEPSGSKKCGEFLD